ncbi:flavonol sulfotransferase-like [Phoenix dactylifera]|uniref:Sulfotransferase n=1 Tax=Phoenix dactylifera TaxID=42345 RepID=A0A8B7BIG0_PHODC|nr:flavonol sulfotransferase-like [Phoenix dactylifera]XP_038975496.1 flavonol sulfotransferase-like [Phoenix dactylifera]
MSSLPCFPIPFKHVEALLEKENHSTAPAAAPVRDYDELISSLPVKQTFIPIRKYLEFWFPEGHLPGIMAIRQHFRPRPDDLFLMSFPKSGTTWLKALAFATMTRAHYPWDRHPLHSLNPHDVVPFMDDLFAAGQASKLEALPSPRVLATHMPYSLLPDSITSSGCRIIYICRDPKDAIVSLWHFAEKASAEKGREGFPFDRFFEMACEGKFPYSPIWDHSLEYWKESLRRPEKVLFLKYEEMLEEPAANVKRLAEFLGCPFSEDEEKGGVVEEIITLCSFEKLKSMEANKKGSQEAAVYKVSNASFFRKGGTGDWRNYGSPEMAQKLDEIVLEKLEGSGLTIPGVGPGAEEATAGHS